MKNRLRSYFDRNSIRFHLFRLVVVVATAALAVSMGIGAIFEWGNRQEQTRQSLVTIADAVAIAASASVAFNDPRAAHDALGIVVARREVEAAAIFNRNGGRLAVYGDDARLPADISALREHQPGFDLLSPSTTLFQPIRLDDATIGYIFIRASLLESRLTFLAQASLAIAVNLLSLMLVLGFGLNTLDRIVAPVRRLAETARQVRRSKNYSLRVAAPADHDEIGDLVTSFNAMLAEIERREQDLANYQGNLEHLVLERTEALHATNRELQAAKEAAELATVSKSRFLAAASHDLRQPIQAINLFSDALKKTALNSEQTRICDYLGQSTRSLGELLNALLDISRLDAGIITAKPDVIPIADIFSNIEAEFATLAHARSLRFRIHLAGVGRMALFADGKLLQSLLRNLIGNAVKYTQRGGILVAVRHRGGDALIQVWDTGIGIAAEHLDQIYDEYFQVANPERDKAKGLGLGLSIAKRLARLLKTTIACRSRPGRGSLFEFRLPLADLPEEPAPQPAEAERFASPTGLRHIVLIEDDAMIIKAMQLSLEPLGMTVAAYASAESALADPQIAQADFYISDFRLPGANGLELLTAIQQRAQRPIRGVLLTGETAPDWIEATQSTPWPVLYKPVKLKDLVAMIEAPGGRP